jgi:hypothetical protein
LRLRDRTCGEAELDFFAALIVCDIWDGYTLHAEYLDLVPITTRECILDTREVFWFELVDLLYVNCKTTCCVKTARTHATFEMFGLLVLH